MASTSGATPYFDPKLQISAEKIPALNLADCRHHIAAVVNMSWPFNSTEGVTKFSFIALSKSNLKFEVDFAGNVPLKLKDHVLICLKGARVISRAKGRDRLPFKLEFPDGFMVYTDGRIIDTFPEDEDSTFVPAWFHSQPAPQSEPSSPQSSAKSETGSSPPRSHSPVSQKAVYWGQEKPFDGHKASRQALGPVARPPGLHILDPSTTLRSATHNIPTLQAQSSYKQLPPDIGEPGPSSLHQLPRLSSGSYNIVESVKPTKQPEAPTNELEIQKPKKRRRRGGKKSHAEPVRNPALDMVPGFLSPLYGPFVPLAVHPDKQGSKINVISVVRGLSIPKLTRNGDWSVSIELLDPSVTEETAFVVNLFLPEHLKDCIPSVKAGDIIMLVKVAVTNYQGKTRGTGYGDTFQWAGYSISEKTHFYSVTRSFDDEEHCPLLKPTQEELQYASQLAEWWKATQELSRNNPDAAPALMVAPRGRSLITLSEAKADVFFNCIVEILFKVPPGDQAAEISVTDYTVHPQFYSREPREDPKTKQEQIKVYGKRVLKVMLWGYTQIEHARELEVGYYYIDNLRVKFDSKGNLEGTLQDDRRKIDKMRKDDPLLEDLLKRKSEYFNRPPSPGSGSSRVGPVRGQDPNLYTAGDLLPPPPVPIITPQQIQPANQNKKSPITRLLYQNIVQTPLQQVLGHASCPEIFRIRARVAAFEPYKLEHFTHGFCAKCNIERVLHLRVVELQLTALHSFGPSAIACTECGDFEGDDVAYEYRFRLCVEEEAARPSQDGYRASLVLDVFGKDAEMFLSGLPPQDFHKVANARKLRSRLAPIFGNLEAYQCDLAAGDSAKARVHGQYFEMLVQSYRSPNKSEGSLDNKRYRLWGTELLPKASK